MALQCSLKWCVHLLSSSMDRLLTQQDSTGMMHDYKPVCRAARAVHVAGQVPTLPVGLKSGAGCSGSLQSNEAAVW